MDINSTAQTLVNCYIRNPQRECYLMETNPIVKFAFENAHNIYVKYFYVALDVFYCLAVISIFMETWDLKYTRYVAVSVITLLVMIVVMNIANGGG